MRSPGIIRKGRNAPRWQPVLLAICLGAVSCGHAPGKPGPGPEVIRPEQQLDFASLYKDNCAACHGNNGRDGAALSLANPIYVAYAKDHLHDTITNGVRGHLMPAFGKSGGGMLTDRQVDALVQGIVSHWADAGGLGGAHMPSYAAAAPGDATRGQQAYTAFCARCHGPNGEGGSGNAKSAATPTGSAKPGSIVDASYLALLSDQNLRSIVVAGRPDQGMPDWRSDGAQPMTEPQIADVVAWMAAKRVPNPGQPYAAGK